MKNYKARGIVLHTIKYGETSLIAYIYTDLFGRQSYMIQGVGSPKRKSNKMAILQPMFPIELEGIDTGYGKLHRIREMKMSMQLSGIPFDVVKSSIALFMAEVLYRLIKEEEQNPELFNFINESVRRLDSASVGTSNFHIHFLLNLSRFLGFYPGNRYFDDNIFDIKAGLFTNHTPDHQNFIGSNESRLLGMAMELEFEEWCKVNMNREQRRSLLNSLLTFFSHHFETINNVRSIAILREVF